MVSVMPRGSRPPQRFDGRVAVVTGASVGHRAGHRPHPGRPGRRSSSDWPGARNCSTSWRPSWRAVPRAARRRSATSARRRLPCRPRAHGGRARPRGHPGQQRRRRPDAAGPRRRRQHGARGVRRQLLRHGERDAGRRPRAWSSAAGAWSSTCPRTPCGRPNRGKVPTRHPRRRSRPSANASPTRWPARGVHVHVLYPGWVPTAMGLSGIEDGGSLPPKLVRRTAAQVATLTAERMGGPRIDINAARLPLAGPDRPDAGAAQLSEGDAADGNHLKPDPRRDAADAAIAWSTTLTGITPRSR